MSSSCPASGTYVVEHCTRSPLSDGLTPRWLTPAEQRAWRAFLESTKTVFDALDRQLQRDADMPHAYFEMLVRLSEAPDRSLRMSELADLTLSSRSRLSHAVARLEERGWVVRTRSETDRRGQIAHADRRRASTSCAPPRPGTSDTVRRDGHRPARARSSWRSSTRHRPRPGRGRGRLTRPVRSLRPGRYLVAASSARHVAGVTMPLAARWCRDWKLRTAVSGGAAERPRHGDVQSLLQRCHDRAARPALRPGAGPRHEALLHRRRALRGAHRRVVRGTASG